MLELAASRVAASGIGQVRRARLPPYCGVVLYTMVRGILVGLIRTWLDVQIIGRENVPTTGGFILAPTHRSNIDFVLASAVTPRRLSFMTKDSVWRSRVLGRVVQHLGGFPVSRGAPDREAIARSLAALTVGNGLVLFPEGQRRSGPAVENLHDGVAYLAIRAQVPIVPIGIAGSGNAQPPGKVFIKPRARVGVQVGSPLVPPITANGRVPRSVIRQLTEDLRRELQALQDQPR